MFLASTWVVMPGLIRWILVPWSLRASQSHPQQHLHPLQTSSDKGLNTAPSQEPLPGRLFPHQQQPQGVV